MLGSSFEARGRRAGTMSVPGRASTRFEVPRGIAQGCNASPTNVCIDMIAGRERRARRWTLARRANP